jgi:hypothetical protein
VMGLHWFRKLQKMCSVVRGQVEWEREGGFMAHEEIFTAAL